MHSFSRTSSMAKGQLAPTAEIRLVDARPTLVLGGEWTVYNLDQIEILLTRVIDHQQSNNGFDYIDLKNVSKIDTSGALAINRVAGFESPTKQLLNVNSDYQAILHISKEADQPRPPVHTCPRIVRMVNSVGYVIVHECRLLLSILSFFGEVTIHSLKTVVKPWRIPLVSTLHHIEMVGIKAVPIVALLNFLIGMVIAYMAASSLSIFGAQIYVVNLLEIVTLREMGVLITAILVAGRSGSAFTAQIGSMVNNQEVDAMRSMGIDPMDVLVLPRLVAITISLPFLVVLADIMALLGGLLAMRFSMDISALAFIQTLQKDIEVKRVLIGVCKAPFFAMTIGCVGCFLGFRVTGSSDSLGAMTTRSVVESIFIVIALDAIFALILSTIGV